MLIGVGADDAAAAGQGAETRAADRARVADESVVGRDVHALDVPAGGAGQVGDENRGEVSAVVHALPPFYNPYLLFRQPVQLIQLHANL
ncbi:MAG: hypothetical protein H3C69_09110 [Candidatus Promineofilum sp.]|nr:hypothetical protein [Promineifilum sp.]